MYIHHDYIKARPEVLRVTGKEHLEYGDETGPIESRDKTCVLTSPIAIPHNNLMLTIN